MGQQDGDAAAMWETAVPDEGDGPRVWITLPDQQVVTGLLLEQRQGSTGSWFCLVSVALWEHVQSGGRDQAQPTSIVTTVPATHVERIEGERYEDVTTRRHPSPRPSTTHEGWYIQKMRTAELRYVHHLRCFCPGDREVVLTREQMRQELAVPGTLACDCVNGGEAQR